MFNLIHIGLLAQDLSRNINRKYDVFIGNDPFCKWSVTIRNGKFNTYGQVTHFGYNSLEEAREKVIEKLETRLSALKRIGCHYELIQLEIAPTHHIRTWMPQKLLNDLLGYE